MAFFLTFFGYWWSFTYLSIPNPSQILPSISLERPKNTHKSDILKNKKRKTLPCIINGARDAAIC